MRAGAVKTLIYLWFAQIRYLHSDQKETIILMDNRFFYFLAKRLDTRAFRRFLINTRQPFRVAIDIGVAACFFALNE